MRQGETPICAGGMILFQPNYERAMPTTTSAPTMLESRLPYAESSHAYESTMLSAAITSPSRRPTFKANKRDNEKETAQAMT